MVKKNDDLENNNILKFVIGIYIAKYAALIKVGDSPGIIAQPTNDEHAYFQHFLFHQQVGRVLLLLLLKKLENGTETGRNWQVELQSQNLVCFYRDDVIKSYPEFS